VQSNTVQCTKHQGRVCKTRPAALIGAALQFTRGRRHEAANLLGYGRNTLTRKIKELDIADLPEE
jgi:DNA-binding NtrC family response regulator